MQFKQTKIAYNFGLKLFEWTNKPNKNSNSNNNEPIQLKSGLFTSIKLQTKDTPYGLLNEQTK